MLKEIQELAKEQYESKGLTYSYEINAQDRVFSDEHRIQ